MFSNLRISTRLGAVIAFLALTLLVAGGAGVYGIRVVNDRLRSVYDDRTVPLAQLSRINALMLSNMREVQLARGHDPSLEESKLHDHPIGRHFDQVAKNAAEIDALWMDYMATFMTAEEKALADDFIAKRKDFRDNGLQAAMTLLKEERYGAAGTMVTARLNALYDTARAVNEKLIRLQIDEAGKEHVAGERDYVFLTTGGLVSILLAIAISAALGVSLIRSIGRPVAAMVVKLRSTLTGVQAASSDVSRESSDLHGEIRSLSERTGQQASNLEETAATQDEEPVRTHPSPSPASPSAPLTKARGASTRARSPKAAAPVPAKSPAGARVSPSALPAGVEPEWAAAL
jgi:hypothetical protein